MAKKRILFAGCSFTANCGFTKDNHQKYHWTNLISRHYDVEYVNIALDGCSNEEIFLRTLEQLIFNKFDLVIIMWSAVGRSWIYYNRCNVDDAIRLTYEKNTGLYVNKSNVKKYVELHQNYFNNYYINVKKWLLQIKALEYSLSNSNQPFIFLKGFENYIKEFNQVEYSNKQGFTNITDNIKIFLDFENRPDDYILEKLSVIQNLIKSIDQSKWVNFDKTSMFDQVVDYADDLGHPGPETNKKIFEQLVTHIDQNNLL